MLPTTMQGRYYAEIFDSPKLRQDFNANMKIEEIEAKESLEIRSLEQKPEQEEEIDDVEEEFSFACPNPAGSPISFDDAFQNGQIGPIYPLFDRDLLSADDYNGESKPQKAALPRHPLKKLFFKEREHQHSSTSETNRTGTYCVWSGKAGEASPEMSKKSNSTGTSKLWKLREPEIRSNSDGKDAFVFLNPSSSSSSTKTSNEKAVKIEKARGKGKGGKSETPATTAAAAHERLYVENRATKESDKRRSYLPYRQVGFFTNVNGLSRNIHPL